MPANLTPQYYEAEKAFKEARTQDEKIHALQEMLAVIPKHKGTEKLQGELKKRLAKMKQESEKKSKGTSTYNPYKIEKMGAGQMVLFGLANVGKSSILGALSNAKVTVAEYPFSTPLPLAGMVAFEDIQIQVVDTPPLIPEDVPGELIGALQRGDCLILVFDASSPQALDQVADALGVLEEKRVIREEIPPMVKAFRREDLLVLANKMDGEGSQENLQVVKELYPELNILPLSTATGQNMDRLPGLFFEKLGVLRVYSKVPGKDADMDAPFILKQGSTVMDMAQEVHQDIAESLEKARIWGSARFDGQAVPRDHVLADKDIVELHAQ